MDFFLLPTFRVLFNFEWLLNRKHIEIESYIQQREIIFKQLKNSNFKYIFKNKNYCRKFWRTFRNKRVTRLTKTNKKHISNTYFLDCILNIKGINQKTNKNKYATVYTKIKIEQEILLEGFCETYLISKKLRRNKQKKLYDNIRTKSPKPMFESLIGNTNESLPAPSWEMGIDDTDTETQESQWGLMTDDTMDTDWSEIDEEEEREFREMEEESMKEWVIYEESNSTDYDNKGIRKKINEITETHKIKITEIINKTKMLIEEGIIKNEKYIIDIIGYSVYDFSTKEKNLTKVLTEYIKEGYNIERLDEEITDYFV